MPAQIRTRLTAAVAAPVVVLVVVAVAQASRSAQPRTQAAMVGAGGWLALAVLSLVVGAVGLRQVRRAVATPLDRLTDHVEALADRGLADAVETALAGGDVGDELPRPPGCADGGDLGLLAQAVGEVQDRAIALAVAQGSLRHDMAEALTSLGRRNQNLLSRQLDYITALEREEADPDKLDQLFRLDHLATRMRRNAESLVVLGGGETPRQWSAPVPVVDVVRSALAEVEDFRRVSLDAVEAVDVAGRSTTDLAHLLAEIIENGLSFSPPQRPVQVSGSTRDGRYVISVVDAGLGMADDVLVQANARLAGVEAGGSVGRYLGLYVAGQLARRHGVDLTLAAGPAGGTVAEISLPAALTAGHGVDPATRGGHDFTAGGVAGAGVGRGASPVTDGRPAPAGTPLGAAAPPAGSAPARVRGDAAPGAGWRSTLRSRRPAPNPGLDDSRVASSTPTKPRPAVRPASAGQPVPAVQPGAERPGAERPGADKHPNVRRRLGRRKDLLDILEEVEEETTAARTRAYRSAVPSTDPGHDADGQPAPALVVAADGPSPFEVWLDSRLEQLAELSLEQSVTAGPSRPVSELRNGDADSAAETSVGLPRRKAVEGDVVSTAGLRRRSAAEVATPVEITPPEGPRVTSSLFRYLSAVDQRTLEPQEEGQTR